MVIQILVVSFGLAHYLFIPTLKIVDTSCYMFGSKVEIYLELTHIICTVDSTLNTT